MYLKTTPIHSLFFAPMEGVTDQAYRLAIHHLYPKWDFYCTDFLRAPTESYYPLKVVKKHIGEKILKDEKILNKTVFQILATPRTTHQYLVSQIQDLGLHRLDLNLGCPSKTVNGHQGGAYLLSDLPNLFEILTSIRKSFQGIFTVKMRVGYRDDLNFFNILKMMENIGVDAITIHARTRDELYTGIANWNYIETAKRSVKIPINGNGDIWTVDDLLNIFEKTNCYGAMLGRGALKTPWFPYLNKSQSPKQTLDIRRSEIKNYFLTLIENYLEDFSQGEARYPALKRLKSLSRYLFDDFECGSEIKSLFLRANTMEDFLLLLRKLTEGVLEEELMQKKRSSGTDCTP